MAEKLRSWARCAPARCPAGIPCLTGWRLRPHHLLLILESKWEKEEAVVMLKTGAGPVRATYLRPEQVLRLAVEPEYPCTCPW